MIDPQALAPLGLNAYEAAAYLALLGRPDLTPAEVASRAKIPRQRVYDVLLSLTSKGLCVARNENPKTYAGVEPKTALDLLALEREASLERQRKEARDLADRLAQELGPIFAAGHGQHDPLAYVEVLSGQTRIAHRAIALAERAVHSVNSCIKRPMILSQEQNWAFMRTPLNRGLRYRALYDEEAMRDEELRGWMEQFSQWGLEIRVAASLPLKMQAFDEEIALISMQDPAAGQPSFTAVLIHNKGAAAMLNLAFEHLWANARQYA
jgi:hypothetical protein